MILVSSCLVVELVGVGKRKLGLGGLFVESDISLIGLTFAVGQSVHINRFARLEFFIFFVIEFLTPEYSGWFRIMFLGSHIVLLFRCLGLLPVLLLKLMVVEYKFHIPLVRIELDRGIEWFSFFGDHPFKVKRLSFQQGLLLMVVELNALDLLGDLHILRPCRRPVH